jgi:hypothetical protein
MKTWKIEMLCVSIILMIVNIVTYKLFTIELLAAIAVVLTFGHTQIADRMAEQEALKEQPDVLCYKKLLYYFAGKELFWCLYFIMNHSYSALVGVIVFLFYPVWRRIYRCKIKKYGQNITH